MLSHWSNPDSQPWSKWVQINSLPGSSLASFLPLSTPIIILYNVQAGLALTVPALWTFFTPLLESSLQMLSELVFNSFKNIFQITFLIKKKSFLLSLRKPKRASSLYSFTFPSYLLYFPFSIYHYLSHYTFTCFFNVSSRPINSMRKSLYFFSSCYIPSA